MKAFALGIALLAVVLAFPAKLLYDQYRENEAFYAEDGHQKIEDVRLLYALHEAEFGAMRDALRESEIECRMHGGDPEPFCSDPTAEARVSALLPPVEYDGLTVRAWRNIRTIDVLLSRPDPWHEWGSGLRLVMNGDGEVVRPIHLHSREMDEAFAPLGYEIVYATPTDRGGDDRNKTSYLGDGWYAYELPYYD